MLCPFFSSTSCYFVRQRLFYWKALTAVSSVGATGFGFSHAGSHPWAGGGMKSSLCHVTGTGHASTPPLDKPLECHQPPVLMQGSVQIYAFSLVISLYTLHYKRVFSTLAIRPSKHPKKSLSPKTLYIMQLHSLIT